MSRRAWIPVAVPVTFSDSGIEPPDLGFVRVADRGAVEFPLHVVR